MRKHYFVLLAVLFFSGLNAQNIVFPDANFKARLVAANYSNGYARNLLGINFKLDANSDGEIQESEAAEVSALFINNVGITNFTGILSFPNLEILDCHNNNAYTIDLNGLLHLRLLYCYNSFLSSLPLTNVPSLQSLNCTNTNIGNLDLSNCPNMDAVNCNQSNLSSLNVSGLTNLTFLDCGTNLLTTLDVSSSNLNRLECQGNQITTLDLTHSTNLTYLNCSSNYLTTLNITGLTAIQLLWCEYNNNLATLDVTPLTGLTDLDCSNTQIAVVNTGNLANLTKVRCFRTQITTLDVSSSPNLFTLYCSQNPLLTSLFFKNGSFENSLDFGTNPLLRYVCVDESQLTYVQSLITNYGMTSCVANSYCTFVPGGFYYTIQGATKYDENSDGCDASDSNYRNLRLAITSGAASGALISNVSGNYSLPVSAGTHVITPVLENPTYFTIAPTTITKAFPAQSSPATQDFCVTANGIHNDLEVTILPLKRARPGFDTKYKILYKNKGTHTQSGMISLVYDDAVLDFVNSNPAADSQTVNNLNWNFSDLHPFETGEIVVTINLNSPVEVPPLNTGDVLNYTVSITAATDETPENNSFTLVQTIVNAVDPNDKTCLEGNSITPEMVGKEMHYIIRFENTGTADAENIVVKDMIDTAKFDISSLVPLDGSHPFETKISNPNKVEFIFENINLPFDDANNDGYVAFKIKTKPTLVLGDTFSNTASIYFDYNAPIITNTELTVVGPLATQDFVFENYIAIHPNPVKDVLNIDKKKDIAITSISIYNTLGQLILTVPNAQQNNSVDVAALKTGNYFMKIYSDKGTSNTKFIKL